jgi:hypothetical protein
MGSGCPSNLRCASLVAKILDEGVARSEKLRSLVDLLASHPGVELEIKSRRLEPGLHAQGLLEVRAIYVRQGDEKQKHVTGVTGEVIIPLKAYGHELIPRLAHELQHVRVLLEGTIPTGSPKAEQAAIEFEQLVRAELAAFGAGEPPGTGSPK